jgi:hypothetical protein
MQIRKTVLQKLGDLEDHLFLLTGALAGLDTGQGAHLRHIAAELRVLICLSSRVEGLVWRLVDELGLDDNVQIHQVGNVDPERPFSQGLRFMFIPLRSPGRGDPRLPVETYSLRDIIKRHEAVYVAGQGVTHETLIKWLAQQVGSAHEGDAVSPVLAELNAVLIANVQPFFLVLRSDAMLTIDVGERVLRQAASKFGYQRRHPSFVQPGATHLRDEVAVTVPLAAPTVDPPRNDEGTAAYLLNFPDPRWKEPGLAWIFPPYQFGWLTLEAAKTPDGFIELRVTGLTVSAFTRRWPLPETYDWLMIHVTWNKDKLLLYWNGALIETILLPASP